MNRQRKLDYVSLQKLQPAASNPRKHSRTQIQAIAKSIEKFGFNAPVITNKEGQIVAGHGRYEAARLLGLELIPVITLDDLTPAQARAYMIADNKLTDRSSWDEKILATHFKELSEMALDFNIEDTGFETPEIDLLIQSLDDLTDRDTADDFDVVHGEATAQVGELWTLGRHRLYCGDALNPASYGALLGDQKAAAVFTDPPFNLPIRGTVSGRGAITHREFVQASGEMTQAEFTTFLSTALGLAQGHVVDGALMFVCMDFRHIAELMSGATSSRLILINLCIWVKTNGGMGSMYRSQHELVFVYGKPGATRRNNIQLGRFGRNRTNVWTYPGANVFPRKRGESTLTLHPTVKPIAMVADAILDVTARNDVVLDPFVGSGTTLLAAERTGRRGYGMELDPLYVDTAIKRWQSMTGQDAKLQSGKSFNELAVGRHR